MWVFHLCIMVELLYLYKCLGTLCIPQARHPKVISICLFKNTTVNTYVVSVDNTSIIHTTVTVQIKSGCKLKPIYK